VFIDISKQITEDLVRFDDIRVFRPVNNWRPVHFNYPTRPS